MIEALCKSGAKATMTLVIFLVAGASSPRNGTVNETEQTMRSLRLVGFEVEQD